MFAATVGGLGLTGLILWVGAQARADPVGLVRHRDRAACAISTISSTWPATSRDWPYTVAWVDCLAGGGSLGRGLFHARPAMPRRATLTVHRERRIARVPVDAPGEASRAARSCAPSIWLYASRPGVRGASAACTTIPSSIRSMRSQDWNRLYGRAGFFQHQSVVPLAAAPRDARRSCSSSPRPSARLLPRGAQAVRRPAIARAAVLPDGRRDLRARFAEPRASDTRLLARMADVVHEAGGRLYPAKDATMSGEAFRAGYPALARARGKARSGAHVGFLEAGYPRGRVSETILVLGATSAIAHRLLPPAGGRRRVLRARRPARRRLETIAADLKARGAAEPSRRLRSRRYGLLREPLPRFLRAPRHAGSGAARLWRARRAARPRTMPRATRAIIDVNFTSAALWLQMAAKHFRATSRARSSSSVRSPAIAGGARNYVYGAAKAGLDRLRRRACPPPARHELACAHRQAWLRRHADDRASRRGGPLWAKPEQIAAGIEQAVRRKQAVALHAALLVADHDVIRLLPRPIFFRTKL